jgi:hypothetical protein
MKTEKKIEKKAQTPKQMIIKINSLIKGIDNSMVTINKHNAAATAALKEVHQLTAGICNAQANKPQPKTEIKKPTPAKKPAPVKKPAPAKKPAEVKTPVAKKPTPVKKALSTKKSAPAAKHVINGDRPPLKTAVREIIIENGEEMPAVQIYNQVTAKYGYYSRQSLGKTLSNASDFVHIGNKFGVSKTNNTVNDEEAEKFISQVDDNSSLNNIQ